ncbi:hypothetical protein [Clostridium sp.]|uniref:hypothetical protein n=1 Tax=Clostridium sp. TaxID=1506 RepID=UPI00283C6AC5|nr:hypothetical protein [Clostridium sp.]MDR3595108.1 hypothetical protein [Clostridium sp.]
MKCVKFIKPLDGYRIDDIASFEDTVAARVIEAGYGAEIALEDTKLVDPNAKK